MLIPESEPDELGETRTVEVGVTVNGGVACAVDPQSTTPASRLATGTRAMAARRRLLTSPSAPTGRWFAWMMADRPLVALSPASRN
jgi:hypothetical protein